MARSRRCSPRISRSACRSRSSSSAPTEQKKKYFPRLAKGAISAFALTETDAGSDPANMRTTATLSEDGTHYILNGEKLWCTNGTRAELMVVMARTPEVMVNGKPKKQITAFIVETSWPGVEIEHRCRFMGLKAIENGVIRFDNVKVPRENILWGEGKGLKLALVTLNTGRLTLPASAAYGAKAMLQVAREWGNDRVQWGQPIGKHEAIAQKIALMAANTFAMESIAELTSAMADRGGYDIRLEAAIAKLWNTEAGWRIVDDALQIRGGRGYEKADSLRARGEAPIPVERAMRDFADQPDLRGLLGDHAPVHRARGGGPSLQDRLRHREPQGDGQGEVARRSAARPSSIPPGTPSRWVGELRWLTASSARWRRIVRFVARTTRKLGRSIFHAMVRLGPKLERRQMVLFRAVDIGAELFAMSAACTRAHMLKKAGDANAIELADLFCRESRRRIHASFANLFGVNDLAMYRVSQAVLRGEYAWLERGIIVEPEPAPSGLGTEAPRARATAPAIAR